MRTSVIGVTAVLVVFAVGCTSSDDSTDPADPAERIEYPSGALDVLIQIGDYHFGWPDEFLVGPEIVVYGDGRVFAELRDPSPADASRRRPVMGELDDATIQSLLRSGQEQPTDSSTGQLGEDEVPTLLVVDDRRWKVAENTDKPLTTLLTDVREAIDEMASTEWQPEQWVVRIGRDDCTLSDQPITPSYHSAPIFPHPIDVDPFPDLDCGG